MRQYHLPHLHKPDWHQLGIDFDKMIHSYWFWPAIVMLFFVLMVILAIMIGNRNTNQLPYYPMHYPFMP